MKKVTIFILLALAVAAAGSARAQTEEDTRDVLLRITNKKGKPVSNVVVHTESGGDVGITDADGKYLFSSLKNDDHILMTLSKVGPMVIPVNGLDSIHVVIRSGKNVDFLNARSNQPINIGYGGSVTRATSTTPVSSLDAEKIVSQGAAQNLYDLLRGRVAGVNVGADGSVTIRGQNSLLLSSEPLVVVDGVASGTVAQVNEMLSVQDIKSISVLKEGSIYGASGANGVILITTK